MATTKRKSKSEDRFAPFAAFKPDKMPWNDLLHRVERIDWPVLQRTINSGDVVQFDGVCEGHVQTWLDFIFSMLGKLNVRFLYVSDPGCLFLMNPAVADELHIHEVQEQPTFATH